jgi:hypothetical protein
VQVGGKREVCKVAELPWRSHSRAAPERDYVALLSYLPLNRGWSIPLLLVYNARILRQLRTSAGLFGYSLQARLAAKRFWTLSVWEDEMAVQAFVSAPPHAAVMKALAPFTRWTVKGFELPPQWDDALKRDGPTG